MKRILHRSGGPAQDEPKPTSSKRSVFLAGKPSHLRLLLCVASATALAALALWVTSVERYPVRTVEAAAAPLGTATPPSTAPPSSEPGLTPTDPASGPPATAPSNPTPSALAEEKRTAPPTTTRPPAAPSVAPRKTGTATPTATPKATTTGYGCGPALSWLRTHAAPGFAFECPGNALGHEAMTCINRAPCPGERLIVIADPCPAAYKNEASNSWVLEGLKSGAIDPFGAC